MEDWQHVFLIQLQLWESTWRWNWSELSFWIYFKQEFENELQKAVPNPWIEKESWLTKTDVTYPVTFGDLTITVKNV